ncbi:MAG TPA: PQQ-binding-like beta-propeller repeat protein, partial [Polyangiales bacterium]
MARYRISTLRCVLALLATSPACAGTAGAFAARYPDNVEGDLRVLAQRIEAAPKREAAPIAVGVSSTRQVYAYDLAARRVLWQVPAAPSFAPQLAGSAVVMQEGDRVIGLDLKTGATRFQFAAGGMHLVGADGAGDRCVVSLVSGQGTFAKSRVVLLRGGARVWSRDVAFPAGVPALVGSVVLVPWSNQYLSGLDAESGDEFARLRVREGVISHAIVSDGQVYAGSQYGIGVLNHDIIATNLKTGPHYDAPKEELPGRPAFLRDAYSTKPLPQPESAENRIRLTWQPELHGKTLELAGNNLYLTFYRFVFALDPNDLALHWVYTHDVDLVGARAERDGIVIGDAKGEVRYLSAQSGDTLWLEKNAPPSLAIEMPPDQSAIGSSVQHTIAATDIRKQLAAAAEDPDSRLVPVRLLAVDLLAKLSDPGATADLLALCEDDRTTISVRKAACNALRQRSTGNEYVLTALQRHAAYLEGTSAPPVGALAKAAAIEKESRATPLLLAHLRDPNTPTPGLAELITSLGQLRDASAAPALAEFLLLYHADPIDEHVARALELTPDVLVRLQGQAARATLSKVAEDPLSAGNVQESARKAIASLDEQARAGEKNPEAEQLAAQQASEAAAKPEPPRAPAHITVDVINQALLPVHDKLQACLKDKPEAFQARVVLVVEDGQV